MMKNKTTFAFVSTLVLGSLLATNTALAKERGEDNGNRGMHRGNSRMMERAPGVFGKVSAISGTTLTVTSTGFGENKTPTTYTINAANAVVTKDNASSTISAIALGDTIMVEGSVTGTTVNATAIRDGVMGRGRGEGMMMEGGKRGGQQMMMGMIGNGQPLVGGVVTAITGTTLTLTNKSNVTYSIDAHAATVTKGRATSTLATIAIGDTLVVQGTVSGTAVTASNILDQGVVSMTEEKTDTTKVQRGFKEKVRGFFSRVFGF